jgi:hypothetical protein
MSADMKRFVQNLKNHNIGWRLLAWCGMWFIPSGILLICLSWHPIAGSYILGEHYPFGTVVDAWQGALGFGWIAFGLLFVGMAFLGVRYKNSWGWFSLLLSMILMLFPHIWLGVNLIIDDTTMRNFGSWQNAIPFSLLWFLLLGTGFAWAYESG